jgi:hypothetical protein
LTLKTIRLDMLWDIDERIVICMDFIDKEHLEDFTPDNPLLFFKDYYCDDILVKWNE